MNNDVVLHQSIKFSKNPFRMIHPVPAIEKSSRCGTACIELALCPSTPPIWFGIVAHCPLSPTKNGFPNVFSSGKSQGICFWAQTSPPLHWYFLAATTIRNTVGLFAVHLSTFTGVQSIARLKALLYKAQRHIRHTRFSLTLLGLHRAQGALYRAYANSAQF